jgi:hypothetical protein
MSNKFVSVRLTAEAVDQDGNAHRVEWDVEPQSLRIEQLRELDGLPHPIEPEILRALPIRLKILGDVLPKARA